MTFTPESLSPGDVLLDSHGDPVLQRLTPDFYRSYGRMQESYQRVQRGDVSLEDFLANAAIRANIVDAYIADEPLPLGTQVVNLYIVHFEAS